MRNSKIVDEHELIAGASKYSNIAPMTTAFCLNTLSRVMRTSIPHNILMITWLVVSKIFYFHHYLGKIPNLTNIFQRG